MSSRADDLRQFVRRDWGLVAEVKRSFWLARRAGGSAEDALRVADSLWLQVRAQRPDWPTPAAREADLAAHVALAETLRRASSTHQR